MKRYPDSYYENLKLALTDAANWSQLLSPHDELETPEKQKELCLERCLNKHSIVINKPEDEISDLEFTIQDNDETISDLEHQVKTLQSQIYELEETVKNNIVPNKTLDDVEKIEFLNKHWYNISYDQLKSLV